jgi:hypothetical protein
VAAEQHGLERVLKILVDGTETLTVFEGYLVSKSQELAQQYKLQQEAAIQEVDALLASAGLDWEAVKAAAFSLRVREIEALNRMISSAENRMKTTLREIDRHRKGFGQELRRAIEQLDDPTTELSKEQEKLKRAA